MINYYDILGVDKNSSYEDIRKQYHKLALKYHPDRNSNKNENEKFKSMSDAYDILGDKEKRKKYDMQQSMAASGMSGMGRGGGPQVFTFHQRGEGGATFSDIFNMFQAARSTYTQFNKRIHMDVHVSLQEVIEGNTKLINIHYKNDANVAKSELHSLTIPKGIENRSLLHIPSQGERGEVYITVHYKKDKDFTPKGPDLHCYMNISFKDSILLPIITITTPTKEKVYIQPDTPIKDKSITKIKNKGLPNNNKHGDVIIHFSVTYPKFTEEQKKLIETYF